jgi:hypothetical protein
MLPDTATDQTTTNSAPPDPLGNGNDQTDTAAVTNNGRTILTRVIRTGPSSERVIFTSAAPQENPNPNDNTVEPSVNAQADLPIVQLEGSTEIPDQNGNVRTFCKETGNQRITFHCEVSFSLEARNPTQSGDILTYPVTNNEDARIHFWGQAVEVSTNSRYEWNFDTEYIYGPLVANGFLRYSISECRVTSVDLSLPVVPDPNRARAYSVQFASSRNLITRFCDNFPASNFRDKTLLRVFIDLPPRWRFNDWYDIPGNLMDLVDLDVDSDNNNGVNLPDRTGTEDQIECDGDKPGKFVTVNHNDDDGDGVPDYADLGVVGRDFNFVPLVLEVTRNLNLSQVSLGFSYPGESSLSLSDFTPDDLDNGFKDYTRAKKATMRIWNASPTEPRTMAQYIQPGRRYTAAELGFGRQRTFYIEGINAAEKAQKTEIEVTIQYRGIKSSDKVIVTVVELNLGVNNSNNSPTLRTGVPDVEFIIDEYDEMVEVQQGGFYFWWSRDDVKFSLPGIVDLAPLVINVPSALLGERFKIYLEARGAGLSALYVYWAESPGDNRREFLQNEETASLQFASQSISEIKLMSGVPGRIRLNELNPDWPNEFLFRAVGSGETTVTLDLLIEEPNTSNKIVADSVKLTIKPTEDYWLFLSTRDPAGPTVPFSYPIDDDRTVEIMRYRRPVEVSGTRDPEKKKYLIMLHGYNVTQSKALDGYNEVYRRLYWLGFRGNFIGLTWDGNEGFTPDPLDFSFFDTNVENAFQTSPALMQFLRVFPILYETNAANVDIMAHSLGNLVMWDALRLYERDRIGETLVRNVISLEAAIWSEAFEPESSLTYVAPSDPITYEADDLKQHSWRFWFNQAGHNIKEVISGQIYHSYVPMDVVLTLAMRENDVVQRNNRHYYRFGSLGPNIPCPRRGVYRGPRNTSTSCSLANEIPALLQPTKRTQFYMYQDLNLPVGATINPMADHNFDATTPMVGWRETGILPEPNNHCDYIVLPFPQIYNWWKVFLAGEPLLVEGREIRFPPAIPIGDDGSRDLETQDRE